MAELIDDILYDENATDEDVIDEDEVHEAILDRLLANVPDEIDKREGSVIYNALAPAAIELSILYQELQYVQDECFADTAGLDSLIRRAAERGLDYKEATSAAVKAQITPDIDIVGCRFLVLDTELAYLATENLGDGYYRLECETAGTAGNLSSGQLLLDEAGDNEDIDLIESSMIVGLIDAGVEDEDVEVFRERYFSSFDSQAFGGNIADYKEKMLELNGVGGCKVYPTWNGGGTVKLVFLNNVYGTPEPALVGEVQTIIDPVQNSGEGKGIAPIGHSVTVEAANSKAIHVSAQITYTDGFSYEAARESIERALDDYFLSLRKSWNAQDNDVGVIVRRSYVENSILSLAEVMDIQDLTLNGKAANIALEPSEVPIRGGFVGT